MVDDEAGDAPNQGAARRSSQSSTPRTPLPPAPPGLDRPVGGSMRTVLRPDWRSIVLAVAATLTVALVLAFTLPAPNPETVVAANAVPALEKARQAAEFPVYVPDPLPPGWHVDSARVDRVVGKFHLHVGYVSPSAGEIGLEQAPPDVSPSFVTRMTGGGQVQGFIDVDGVWWVYYRGSGRITDALVQFGERSTIVISGTSNLANLENFARSLKVSLGETNPAG